jgi:ankyrin repeat protein
MLVALVWRNGCALSAPVPSIPSPPLCGIYEAAQSGNLKKVKALLKDDPYLVFSNDTRLGRTPLFYAAEADHKDVVELLLTNKADANAKDCFGNTPLFCAASMGNKDVAELLLANKAEVNAKCSDDWTPLVAAAYYGKIDVAELLLAYKADVNAKTKDGWTPLLAAVNGGHKDMADVLRQHGGHE